MFKSLAAPETKFTINTSITLRVEDLILLAETAAAAGCTPESLITIWFGDHCAAERAVQDAMNREILPMTDRTMSPPPIIFPPPPSTNGSPKKKKKPAATTTAAEYVQSVFCGSAGASPPASGPPQP